MFERELRELSFVPRWGTTRVQRRQSVAEHSWFTAVYAIQIMELFNVASTSDKFYILAHAICHDLEEGITGDVISPIHSRVKTQLDGVVRTELPTRHPELSGHNTGHADNEAIVKTASVMDDIMYLMTEKQMGNSAIDGIAARAVDKLHESWMTMPFERDTLEAKWTTVEEAIKSAERQQSRFLP
jgi:5'-deoxynucleotidase YfbR-like HD superfamily hydrolase